MPWFRLEESFHSHPKVVAAGNAAAGLWVRCGTYSAQYLTDGYIPDDVIARYREARSREVERLLAARLWVQTDGGVLMPDYLEYNPSAADVKLKRKLDLEVRRAGGRSRVAKASRNADGTFASGDTS
jgi:hypothetical protein